MIRVVRLFLIAAVVVLFGCATARTVSVTPGKGGVVALKPGLFGDPRQKATELINGNCGSGHTIVKEGEAVIGTTGEERERTTWYGGKAKDIDTTNKTEWRIKYKCDGASFGKKKKKKKKRRKRRR